MLIDIEQKAFYYYISSINNLRPIMTMLEQVVKTLKAIPLSEVTKISVDLNIPLPTLHKIRYGKSKNPRILTIQALHDHFSKKS
jgi:hypothetical protein